MSGDINGSLNDSASPPAIKSEDNSDSNKSTGTSTVSGTGTGSNNKDELKRVSFSAILTKSYPDNNYYYPSDGSMEGDGEAQTATGAKPSFLVGDMDNGSPDEDTFEAKDDFPDVMVEQGSRMSAYERNLMEKRRRLRYVKLNSSFKLLMKLIKHNILVF